MCAECARKKQGKTTMDNHHIAGAANDPATIPIPVNDHRAILSEAQHDWPPPTLRNSLGSPMLRAAGCIRGFVDTVRYLLDSILIWIADLLEAADAYLTEVYGPQWWRQTPLVIFCRKEKSNDKS
jgi:hypothetical protein